MRTETSSWIEQIDECEVNIQPSAVGENRVSVSIGFHSVFFMSEVLLNVLIKNLLAAQLRYIEETKGETKVS